MLNISVHLDHVRYGTKKVLKPDSGKTIYIGFTIYILCLVLCLGNPGTGNLEAASDLIASETVTAPSVAVTRNSASSVSVNFMRVSVPSGGSKQETASAPSGAVSRPSGSTSVKAPAGVSVPRSQTSGSQVNVSTGQGAASATGSGERLQDHATPSKDDGTTEKSNKTTVKPNDPVSGKTPPTSVAPQSSQTVTKPVVPAGAPTQLPTLPSQRTNAAISNTLNFSPKPVPERAAATKSAAVGPFGAPPFIPSSPTASNDVRVERAVTFWVLDGDGNWKIPLPNWTIEDILGSIDTRKAEDRELPYTIQSVNVDGRVEGNIAKLKVEFRISTTTSAVVRVPLGLKEGVCLLDDGKHDIYDAIGYVGLGNYSIEYDEQANGYVALIQSRPVSAWSGKTPLKSTRKDETPSNPAAGNTPSVSNSEAKESGSDASGLDSDRNLLANRNGFGRLRSGFSLHTLTMTLCFPVRNQGKEEYSLTATFPPTVHAKLRLVVPQPDVQIRVNQGVIGLPPTNLNETTSEIVLSGLNRNWEPSELVWFKKDRPITEERAILQIEDAEINAFPGVQDIQYAVKLPIRTYGGDSDTFRIRLPKYARLVRDSVVATGLNNSVLEIQDIKEIKPTEVVHTVAEKAIAEKAVAEKTNVVPAKPAAVTVKPDGPKPDTIKPNTTKPETPKPDAAKPNTPKPNTTKPDTPKPDAAPPNTTKPDTPKPDATKPNTPKPNTTDSKPANTVVKPTVVKPETSKPEASTVKSAAASEAEKPVATLSQKAVAADTSGAIVEITLSRKVRDAVIFQFKAVAENTQGEHAAVKSQTTSQDWELGGFEVLGAQKQHGRVKIQFPEGLNFKVTPSYGVRPILEEVQDVDEQTEQYRFFTQPFSLKAQVIVRQTRIKVKPEYQISVQQGQIELRALFQYSVHGSKVKQLSFRFGDWIINEVKSNYIVDVDKIYTEPVSKEVVLPLTAGSEGFIEVELVAVRDLNRKGDLLDFQLPLPVADWIDPAAVVIVPDDNIELIPLPEQMRMLRPRSRRSFSLYFEIPSRQQPPLMFQAESCDSRKTMARGQRVEYPVFASTIKFHTRKVQVQSQTDVLLQGREGEQIQQTLLYHVAYEPLEAVTFLVPRELQDPAAVKITVQGKPIAPQKIVTESSDDSQSKSVRKKIFLTEEPLIGNCVIVLRYGYKAVELIPKMSNKIVLSLVRPEDGTLTANRLSVNTPAGITVEHNEAEKDGWKTEENSPVTKGDTNSWLFSSLDNQESIILRGIVEARDVLGTTVIERAWLQTWLAGTTRVDRIAWKITSDQSSLLIELPRQCHQDRVSVLVNNVPYFGVATTGNETVKQRLFDRLERLVIQVPEEFRLKPFTLEVAYTMDVPDYDVRYLREIDFPRFVGSSVWVRRSYWQVILPTKKHLVGEIAGWTPEYCNGIAWGGLFWKRVESMNQDELCGWVGVAKREKIPVDTNIYLFSSFNQPNLSFIYVADRGWLIFVGSGITLLIGLCLIYFPVLRHRGIILFLAIVFLGVCCWRPAVTLLFLQTTILGSVLTLVALFLAKQFRSAGESVSGPDRRYGHAGTGSPSDSKISRVSSSLWLEEKSESGVQS